MFKKIERQIQIFTKATGMVRRQEIVHGTLYVKFNDDRDCDFFHKELRTFYRKFISAENGGGTQTVEQPRTVTHGSDYVSVI